MAVKFEKGKDGDIRGLDIASNNLLDVIEKRSIRNSRNLTTMTLKNENALLVGPVTIGEKELVVIGENATMIIL